MNSRAGLIDLAKVASRERAAWILTALALLATLLFAAGSMAEERARTKLASWDRTRGRQPVLGCGLCGQLARYDVARLVRKQGEVVGRVPIGLRCEEHREAESPSAETGFYTALVLQAFGALLFVLAIGTSVRPLLAARPHPLWPFSTMRPARRCAAALGLTIWVGVFIYILAVSFKDAYSTLPLWTAMGGLLCMWLYDLLSGGEYLRCTECRWRGNLSDVRHTHGACPHCTGVHFRVQELLRAHREGLKTTYHFRMMVGLTLAELEDLERSGRIWKEPRGSWALPSRAPEAMPA